MHENPLRRLQDLGQSVWLDNLDRSMLESGQLERWIREDGVSGITSNPATFAHAIVKGGGYDEAVEQARAAGASSARETYEWIAVRDVRDAADLLASEYATPRETDGFVSVEVSPHLAHDTPGTIQEAKRLWNAVARPNVMIKIPGTVAGLKAIEECVAQGINVNITLLFSLPRYREVHRAYLRGLERRRERGDPLDVVSVASFFLSRIDTKVDRLLEGLSATVADPREAQELKGTIAVASAKLAYQAWLRCLRTERWTALQRAGASPQRLLWASTSTKDPDYSDVKYVEPLVGPETVTTLPEETLHAFRDHGRVEEREPIGEQIPEERGHLNRLAALGLDLHRIANELVDEGVDRFIEPYDRLMSHLAAEASSS